MPVRSRVGETVSTMKLSPAQVEHVAELAQLALSDEEKELFGRQLSTILEYAERLQEVAHLRDGGWVREPAILPMVAPTEDWHNPGRLARVIDRVQQGRLKLDRVLVAIQAARDLLQLLDGLLDVARDVRVHQEFLGRVLVDISRLPGFV